MDWKPVLEKQIELLEKVNEQLMKSAATNVNLEVVAQDIRHNALAIKELVHETK